MRSEPWTWAGRTSAATPTPHAVDDRRGPGLLAGVAFALATMACLLGTRAEMAAEEETLQPPFNQLRALVGAGTFSGQNLVETGSVGRHRGTLGDVELARADRYEALPSPSSSPRVLSSSCRPRRPAPCP